MQKHRRDTGRRPGNNEGRNWGDAAVSQRTPRIAESPPKLGRVKEGFFP